MYSTNPFLAMAHKSQEHQDSSSKAARSREPDEVLREAREKHSRYKTFVTHGSFKPSTRRVGMSRIQYGDGDFDNGVEELQRFREPAPRADPLPEMEAPVRLTRTLSRSASLAATLRRGAAPHRDSSNQQQRPGQEDDADEEDDEEEGPARTSAALHSPSRSRFCGVFGSVLRTSTPLSAPAGDSGTAGSEEVASSAPDGVRTARLRPDLSVWPSLHSLTTPAPPSQFKSPVASPMRRTPGLNESEGLTAERWDGRSSRGGPRDAQLLLVPAVAAAGDGSFALDSEGSPGASSSPFEAPPAAAAVPASPLAGSAPTARGFDIARSFRRRSGSNPRGLLPSSRAPTPSWGAAVQAGRPMTDSQLLLDLSALDSPEAAAGGSSTSGRLPSHMSSFGSRGSQRRLVEGLAALRSDRDGGGGGGGLVNKPQSPSAVSVVSSLGVQGSPAVAGSGSGLLYSPSPLALSSSSLRNTQGVEDGLSRGCSITADGAGPAFAVRLGQPRLGSPADSPPYGSPGALANRGRSGAGGGGGGMERRSIDIGAEQAARNAVLSGWSTRRSARALSQSLQQQPQQQPFQQQVPQQQVPQQQQPHVGLSSGGGPGNLPDTTATATAIAMVTAAAQQSSAMRALRARLAGPDGFNGLYSDGGGGGMDAFAAVDMVVGGREDGVAGGGGICRTSASRQALETSAPFRNQAWRAQSNGALPLL